MRAFSGTRDTVSLGETRDRVSFVQNEDFSLMSQGPPLLLLTRRSGGEAKSRSQPAGSLSGEKKSKTGAYIYTAQRARARARDRPSRHTRGLSTLIYQEKQIVRDNSPVAGPAARATALAFRP